MATLGALKARVILETNRDDLLPGGEAESALNGAIERAIEHHSDEAFWFNRASASTVTIAQQGQVVIPYAIRSIDSVVQDGSKLQKSAAIEIEHIAAVGRPAQWADGGEVIHLRPIPDAAYPLFVFGMARIDPPEDDSDENAWTNEALDLIAARTRFLLFRDVFRDVEGTQLAAQAEGEALTRLRKESRRRIVTPLRSTGDEPWSAGSIFDINRGI